MCERGLLQGVAKSLGMLSWQRLLWFCAGIKNLAESQSLQQLPFYGGAAPCRSSGMGALQVCRASWQTRAACSCAARQQGKQPLLFADMLNTRMSSWTQPEVALLMLAIQLVAVHAQCDCSELNVHRNACCLLLVATPTKYQSYTA